MARVQLPFVRHGRLLRFDRLALDRWLEEEVKYVSANPVDSRYTCPLIILRKYQTPPRFTKARNRDTQIVAH